MGIPYPNSGGFVGVALGLAFALAERACVGCANLTAGCCARGCGLMQGLGPLVGGLVLCTVVGWGLGVLAGVRARCIEVGLRLGVV